MRSRAVVMNGIEVWQTRDVKEIKLTAAKQEMSAETVNSVIAQRASLLNQIVSIRFALPAKLFLNNKRLCVICLAFLCRCQMSLYLRPLLRALRFCLGDK